MSRYYPCEYCGCSNHIFFCACAFTDDKYKEEIRQKRLTKELIEEAKKVFNHSYEYNRGGKTIV